LILSLPANQIREDLYHPRHPCAITSESRQLKIQNLQSKIDSPQFAFFSDAALPPSSKSPIIIDESS